MYCGQCASLKFQTNGIVPEFHRDYRTHNVTIRFNENCYNDWEDEDEEVSRATNDVLASTVRNRFPLLSRCPAILRFPSLPPVSRRVDLTTPLSRPRVCDCALGCLPLWVGDGKGAWRDKSTAGQSSRFEGDVEITVCQDDL